MTNHIGTMIVKLVLDTSDLESGLAELNRAADKAESRIDRIESSFRGANFSPEDADKIITMVRSRTRG